MIYRLIIISLTLLTFTVSNVISRKAFREWDEFGFEISDSDCPRDKNINPVISVKNDTYGPYFALSCFAAYPITVEFDGPRPNKATVKTLLTSANPQNSTQACYIVHFTSYAYYGSYSPVGTYNCKGLISREKITSVYVFAKESWNFPTFNAQPNQIIHVNAEKVTKLTFPCPSSKESLTKATLIKYEPLTNEKNDLSTDKDLSVSYDQKLGFTVGYPSIRHENVSEPVGRFVCKDPSDLEGPYSIEFNVFHSDFVVSPNKTKLTFSKEKRTLECYASEPVTIKLLGSNVKDLKVTPNTDFKLPDRLTEIGYSYGAKATLEINDPKAKGQIACVSVIAGKEKQLFVWNFDNDMTCRCEWNSTTTNSYNYYYEPTPTGVPEYGESDDPRTGFNRPNNDYGFYEGGGYIQGEVTCWNEKATIVDWTIVPCKNEIECGMMKSCLEQDNIADCPYYNDYSYMDRPMQPGVTNSSTRYQLLRAGLLRCSVDGYTTVSQVTSDLEKNMHFDGQKPKKIIEIRVAEERLYTGDKIIFACRSSDFFILSQLTWAFEFNDGTFKYPEFAEVSRYTRRYSSYGSDDRTSIDLAGSVRTSFLTIPSKDAKRLWCFAPKWNSTDWEKVSVDLTIESATLAENPPKCPTGLAAATPFIVMLRNSTISIQRIRLPHRVDGTDQSIFDPVESISLYCLAKYPVRWTKDGVDVTNAISKRSNCKQKNGNVLNSRLYKSTIVAQILGTNSSGNYTCSSTTPSQSKKTSVYIFAIGHENRTSFINEGHHYEVYHEFKNQSIKDLNKWAIIPCRLNNPKKTPYLFVDHAEEERMEFINFDNSYLSFDTKIGFKIDVTSRYVNSLTTSFICSDHKDGSFIGNIVTLHLVHDVNATLTTTTPPSVDNSTKTIQTTTTKKPTVTRGPTKSPIIDQGRSNSGFIISIVLLTSLCFACFGMIYHLYQKITIQQNKIPVTQELDWANATNHNSGNNIQNYTDNNRSEDDDPPKDINIDQYEDKLVDNNSDKTTTTDNNTIVSHNENHNNADDDNIINFDSMPSLSEISKDFNYQKF